MSISEELARLARLRDDGVLTEVEFEQQKAAVLRGDPSAASGASSAPAKSKFGKGCLILVGILVVLMVIGLIAGGGKPSGDVVAPTGSGETKEAAAPAAESGPSLTMDGYNRVRNGMTFKQVTAIIGAPSQEMSRNEIAGTETVMYMWEGSMGANMNAMFQNNKLVQKAQFGLR